MSLDPRVSSSLEEIQTRWTLADIYRTQQVLADIDRAQARHLKSLTGGK